MEGNPISNYEKLCMDWRAKFQGMDKELLQRKLPELKTEGDYLTLIHFGRKYGIHAHTGEIIAPEDTLPIRMLAKLNIYTLLWFSKENAFFMDKWVPFQELKNARPFGPAYKKGVTDVFSATFSGHLKELKEAFKKLGGQPLPQGDVGYQLQAFACMPMRFYFWDCDEEFPAQANILFDYSATDYNHIESAVSTAEEGLSRLAETAGLLVKGHSFDMK